MSQAMIYGKHPPSTLDQVVRRIHEISTLPQIAMRVLEVANDSDSNAADLKAVMESDPALSARVLRCVNSSAYAVRQRITSLQQAIAYLGLKQVRNLALTASVSELFRNDNAIGPYRRSSLWRHLVAVGLGAKLIAMRMKFPDFEDAFLAGLLHDIGIILEDQHVHKPFEEMILSLRDGVFFTEIEQEHFSFDHTQLGEKVAEEWRFPESTQAAIRHHHASAGYKGAHLNIVRCVEVANLLCTLKGIPSVGVKSVKYSPKVFDGLSLGRHDIAILGEDLDRELEDQAVLFEM